MATEERNTHPEIPPKKTKAERITSYKWTSKNCTEMYTDSENKNIRLIDLEPEESWITWAERNYLIAASSIPSLLFSAFFFFFFFFFFCYQYLFCYATS
jgi:hypothetical protein